MIDSGACYHIVGSRSLTPAQNDLITRPAQPYRLETANGLTVADKELDIRLDGLGMEVRALVLDNSPKVLSLGELCCTEGYEFHWIPGGPPTLVHPDGTRYEFLVQNNVPVLPAASSTDPRPAEGETAPPDESEADSRPVPQPSSTPDPRLGIPVNHELTHFLSLLDARSANRRRPRTEDIVNPLPVLRGLPLSRLSSAS